jgi:D-tyrosyl-tRNA(Tyr) deacylase
MKAVLQRVLSANIHVNNRLIAEIGKGYLVFLGIGLNDNLEIAKFLAHKICNLRAMADENNKMNLNLNSAQGSLMIVSQFTLYADLKKGNRPSFINAMHPEKANEIYDFFVKECEHLLGKERVVTGIFGADMKIQLINDGPVTFVYDFDHL